MNRAEAIKLLVNATYSEEWQGNENLTTAHNMAIKALEDMEWLAKKRPCDFCKHHKTIYEQDGYYSECTRWECQFEAGKGEEEDRR